MEKTSLFTAAAQICFHPQIQIQIKIKVKIQIQIQIQVHHSGKKKAWAFGRNEEGTGRGRNFATPCSLCKTAWIEPARIEAERVLRKTYYRWLEVSRCHEVGGMGNARARRVVVLWFLCCPYMWDFGEERRVKMLQRSCDADSCLVLVWVDNGACG